MYSINTYKEKTIVGSKIKISYFYLDLWRRERRKKRWRVQINKGCGTSIDDQ